MCIFTIIVCLICYQFEKNKKFHFHKIYCKNFNDLIKKKKKLETYFENKKQHEIKLRVRTLFGTRSQKQEPVSVNMACMQDA